MINSNYIKRHEVIFSELLQKVSKGYYDECTLPSYAHANKFISWLFWRRIHNALSMAGDLTNKSVLDFGCGGGVAFKYLNECHCTITGCENKFYQLAMDMSRKLNVQVTLYRDLFDINNLTFDCILALDVLEHVENLDLYLDKFVALSHDATRIVISGPTENLLYRIGRTFIGYADQARFHDRTIYDIEKTFKEKGLKHMMTKSLYFPVPLFRVSAWHI